MSNYIISYDLKGAHSGLSMLFMNEMMKLGWIAYDKRTIDQKTCRLPNTTLLIRNKTDAYVLSSVQTAAREAKLAAHGASVSKYIISEFRRVHFDSDEPLDLLKTKANDLVRQTIESEILD